MNVETKRFLPLVTQYIYVDSINRRGRRVTVIMLSVAVALLCALFAWFGARRLHVLLVDQADRQSIESNVAALCDGKSMEEVIT